MRKRFSSAMICALCLLFAGCSRSNENASQLAALERAYKAGILTANEYAAKKAALGSQPQALAALDKAFQAGVLTKAEYDAKRSALLQSAAAPQSPSGSPIPLRPVAQVPQSGSSQASAPGDGHSYRMQLVKVMDSQGFERPIVSATMLIPTDWQFQGATTWNIKDSCNTIQTTMRASGPDGSGFEVFPAYTWVWADNPTFLQQAAAQKAQFGTHPCDVKPPMTATDYLKANLKSVRPDATLVGFEQAPKLIENLQDQAQQAQKQAAQFNLRQQIKPDAIRARIRYMLGGKPVEEWVFAAVITTATLGPSYDPRTMRLIQSYSYNIRATASAARAPQGKLDSSEKFFELLNSTFHVDAQWQARVTQGALKIQQIELKGERDRANIRAQTAEDIRKMQQESFENRQRAQDQSFAEFDQVIRGVESYRNPNSGESVELDSRYGNAWVNGAGEYVLTDQAGWNPNEHLQGSWTPMEHVKPQP